MVIKKVIFLIFLISYQFSGLKTLYGNYGEIKWETGYGSSIGGYGNGMIISDIDNDGIGEILFGNLQGFVHILEYSENEYIDKWKSIDLGQGTRGVVVADIDRDDSLEIVAIGFDLYEPGNYDRGFIYAFNAIDFNLEWQSPDIGSDVYGLAVANVDTDNALEMVITIPSHILIFDGITKVQEGDIHIPGAIFLFGLALADIDNDGTTEIIVTDEGGLVHVFDGLTHETEWVSGDLGSQIWDVVVADCDSDGTKEIIVGEASSIYIFDGITYLQEWCSENKIPGHHWALAAADIDNNDTCEIIDGTASGTIYVINGINHEIEWQSEDIGNDVTGLAVGDCDGDGNQEIVAGTRDGYMAIFDALDHILEYKNDERIGKVLSVAASDADGDGSVEIVTGNYDGYIDVFDGATHECEWDTSGLEGNLFEIIIKDIDYDNINEIIAVCRHIYIFDGISHYLEWEHEGIEGFGALSAAIADIDYDGVQEIVLSGFDTTMACYIYVLNTMTHEFEWGTLVPGYEMYALAVENIDEDDAKEIIVSNGNIWGHGQVFIYDGLTHELEWSGNDFGTGIGGIAVDDVDLDDTKEIVFGDNEGLLWILNGDNQGVEWISPALGWELGDYNAITLTNADNDSNVEIIAGSNGYLYVLSVALTNVTPSNFEELPVKPNLSQNYPNPFNPITTIRYDLPEDSHVFIKIYDILGREVRTLINYEQTAGYKSIEWDGKNNNGLFLGSGVYIYQMSTEDFTNYKKMLILR